MASEIVIPTESSKKQIAKGTFQKETGHKGGIQVSLVTTYGLHENMYSEISPVPITMEELLDK